MPMPPVRPITFMAPSHHAGAGSGKPGGALIAPDDPPGALTRNERALGVSVAERLRRPCSLAPRAVARHLLFDHGGTPMTDIALLAGGATLRDGACPLRRGRGARRLDAGRRRRHAQGRAGLADRGRRRRRALPVGRHAARLPGGRLPGRGGRRRAAGRATLGGGPDRRHQQLRSWRHPLVRLARPAGGPRAGAGRAGGTGPGRDLRGPHRTRRDAERPPGAGRAHHGAVPRYRGMRLVAPPAECGLHRALLAGDGAGGHAAGRRLRRARPGGHGGRPHRRLRGAAHQPVGRGRRAGRAGGVGAPSPALSSPATGQFAAHRFWRRRRASRTRCGTPRRRRSGRRGPALRRAPWGTCPRPAAGTPGLPA